MTQAILLIDAVTQDLTPLHAALRAQGYAPTTVLDSSDPVAEFSTTAYELVFINMACHNAQGMCEGIRNKPEGTIMPIIFVGDGKRGVSSPAEALAVGGDYYFAMPLDLARVAAKVQTYVGAPTASAQSGAVKAAQSASIKAASAAPDEDALSKDEPDDDLLALTTPSPKASVSASLKSSALDDDSLLDELASPSVTPPAAPKVPPRSTPEKTAPSPVDNDDLSDLDNLRKPTFMAARATMSEGTAGADKHAAMEVDPLRDVDTLASEPKWATRSAAATITHAPPEALPSDADEAIAQTTLQSVTLEPPMQHAPPPPAAAGGREPTARIEHDELDELVASKPVVKPAPKDSRDAVAERGGFAQAAARARGAAPPSEQVDFDETPMEPPSTHHTETKLDVARAATDARPDSQARAPTSADPYQAAHDEPLDDLEDLASMPSARGAAPQADDATRHTDMDDLRLRSEWSSTATGGDDFGDTPAFEQPPRNVASPDIISAPEPTATPPARATQDLAEASDAVLAEISRREAELVREAEALRREAERLKQEEARIAAAEAARLAAAAEAARQRELERQAQEEAAARAAAEKLEREKAEAEEKVRQAVLQAEARARAEAEAQREREAARKREEDQARARAAAEHAARQKAANEVRRAEEEARRRAEEEALAAAVAASASRSSATRPRANQAATQSQAAGVGPAPGQAQAQDSAATATGGFRAGEADQPADAQTSGAQPSNAAANDVETPPAHAPVLASQAAKGPQGEAVPTPNADDAASSPQITHQASDMRADIAPANVAPANVAPVTPGATVVAALPTAEITKGPNVVAPTAPLIAAGIPTLGHKPLEPPSGALCGNRDIPTLLVDCYEQKITGRLDVTADQRQKTVFFESGAPIDAYSSQLYDRMEEYLLRHGKITRSQHQEVRAKRLRTAREVGAYLVNEGFLKTEELFTAVRGQLEEMIYGLFEWGDATYTYRNEITGVTDRVFLDSDPRALVLEGVRRKYSMERLVKAVGSSASLVGLKDDAVQIVKALKLTPDEVVALRMLDGQRTIEDLVFSSGLEAQRVYQLVYGLVLCGAAAVVARGLDPLTDGAQRSDSIDKARILEKTEQVRLLDYFSMLGLTREATPYEIERACQEASDAFEPQRFSDGVRHELRLQLAEIVEVLGDARHVLGDPDRRQAYARHLP